MILRRSTILDGNVTPYKLCIVKVGNRQILEKPIPQISENGKVCVIVEKNIRNWQICEIVEMKMVSPCYSRKYFT